MSDTHYLGEFQSLSAAWKMFPNGAGYGDYITIDGVRYDWDESTNSWGEDPGDVNPALPEIVNHDIDVQGTVIARDGIKTADYIPGESGAFIDGAGGAEFRSVNVDALWVKDPVTGEHMFLPDFIKKYKTELPPDWAEYEQIPQFDNVRILAFDPLSQDKFYTTIGALKKLISDSIGAGSTGSGTFDIEILRSDDPGGIPTDNNVYSSLKTIQAIQSALGPVIGQYLSRLNPDEAKGLIKFLAGAEFGEFISGIFGGKGARIDELGNIEATSLALRGFLSAPEYRFNRITFVGDEIIFSDMGTIDEVELLEGKLYRLTMRLEEGDNLTFKVGDLVKGIYHYNTYGFSTSYMRVESVIDKYMDVLLVDNDDTPTLSNYPPTQFMKIARIGYAGVDFPERSRYVVASSKAGGIQVWDGCVDFLSGRIVASMDLSQAFKSQYGDLPTKDGLPYLYAAGIVTEDIIRVDYKGVPVREVYDRGAWKAGVIYYNNDENGTDDVWHLGVRWRCFASSTTEEPSWTSADWVNIEGRPNMMIVIEQYYISTSSSELVGGEWTEEIPIWEEGKYIYSRSKILYQDGSETFTDPVYVPILNGKSVTKIDVEYATSSSREIAPTGGWQTTDPGVQQGEYLWSRTIVYYSDGNHEIFGEACISGNEGDPGEDGITISQNQQGYTYRADLNGDIIGPLANGMVELTITSGSTPITCSSATSGETPITNGTYRVTRTLGNGITTNSSLSGGKYRITPATLTVDEASVELEIKIMMDGVVTSYPLTLTYRKQFDGADGKSTEFIFKGSISDTTAPTLPSTSQQDDWYGQGTSYEWNDDLVEPTKTLPYVWASQRKKVDGVWGAFTPAKVWLRYAKDAESLILSASSPTMACYSTNVAKTGQTITINAKLQNVSGTASFTATPYNSSGTALTKITLGGSGNTRTLTNAQWLATFQKVVITATLGSLSDTVTITRLPDGGPGEDGYSVSLTKSEHTYNYNKYGNLKGLFSDGMVMVEVMKGSNTFICDSLATLSPTVNDTYRVTSITQSPASSITYDVYRVNSMFRLIPAGMTVDEVEITFTIVARSDGNNTTFTRKIKYQKHKDGSDGETGEDGYSVSLTKSEHTYNYNKYGNLKGRLSDGVVSVEVMKGSNTLICDSLGVLSPTVNDTYRVTGITQSPTSSITYNVDRPNSVFMIIPTQINAEEVMITFTIVARTKGINTTFTRQLKYQKSHDGADGTDGEDGTDGTDGDGVVHIYKQYPTKPTTPSSGVINPTGWSRNPDYSLSIASQTNWTVNGKWRQSEELTTTGNSATSKITFTTYKNAQTITLELWADGHATYDYVYAGKLNTAVSTSNYYDRVVGGKKIITYDVPTAGNHYIDIFWRKGTATIARSNRGYYAIISDVKVWRSTTNVIGGVVQDWSEPQQFDIDTSTEERIYCLSKTTTAPLISDSDAYINDYIPLPCSLSSYRGDFTTSRAYSIGQVVRYQLRYYKVVKAVTSSYTGNPSNTQYFELIAGWTDNPTGANKDFPYEFIAIRKKQSDGLWGQFVPSVWSNYAIGTNYIHMGWWNSGVTYSKTDLGIPLVKKEDGTALGYSVYTLKADASTPGTFILSEWDLVESADFIYMEQAYIERLQAEIITADKINAIDITAKRLISPFVEVGVNNFQSSLSDRHNVRIMDPGISPVTYPWQTVFLPSGIAHDGLNIKIYAPYGAVKRLKIRPAAGGLIFTDEPIGAYTQLKLSYNTRARIHLSSSWDTANNVLDWHMTSYSSYMISNGPQNTGMRIPTVFKPGDILFSASIASNGVISSINSKWLKAITCSWNSSTGYMITIPWQSYYNTSGGTVVPEIPMSKFSIIATPESGALRRTMVYTLNNVNYQRTQIYVTVATGSTITPNQNAFNIVVKATDYIVQDPYLEELVD